MDRETPRFAAVRTLQLRHQDHIDLAGLRERHDAAVDREGVLKALRDFVDSNDLKVDWAGIEEAPNEALVNALCMMSPFGPREKQAMLEAPDLKTRAEVLIAVTEMELVRGSGSEPTLQ